VFDLWLHHHNAYTLFYGKNILGKIMRLVKFDVDN